MTVAEVTERIAPTSSTEDIFHQGDGDKVTALREAVPGDLLEKLDKSVGSFKHTLGNALSRKAGERFPNGLHVEKDSTGHRKVARWTVRGDGGTGRTDPLPSRKTKSTNIYAYREGGGFVPPVPPDGSKAQTFQHDNHGGTVPPPPSKNQESAPLKAISGRNGTCVRRDTAAPCRFCGGTRFWLSMISDLAVCALCHPPADENLVSRWIGEEPVVEDRFAREEEYLQHGGPRDRRDLPGGGAALRGDPIAG